MEGPLSWTVCLCPTQLYMLKPEPPTWWCWKLRPLEVLILDLDEVIEWGPCDGIIRDQKVSSVFLSAVWGDSKKRAICKSGREFSPGTESACILDLYFPASETVRKNCRWSHPVYSVLAWQSQQTYSRLGISCQWLNNGRVSLLVGNWERQGQLEKSLRPQAGVKSSSAGGWGRPLRARSLGEGGHRLPSRGRTSSFNICFMAQPCPQGSGWLLRGPP